VQNRGDRSEPRLPVESFPEDSVTEGRSVTLEISDSGGGMDKEGQARSSILPEAVILKIVS
jgi:hypothetical protein